jgi:AAA+ ATPase superfamily predicted ATPase
VSDGENPNTQYPAECAKIHKIPPPIIAFRPYFKYDYSNTNKNTRRNVPKFIRFRHLSGGAMPQLIGRIHERQQLETYYNSAESEFIALYGRRRVGKTFLIREHFKNRFSFSIEGLAHAGKQEQLHNFNHLLNEQGLTHYPQVGSWYDTFVQLADLIDALPRSEKKVIFLDEMPWMDTKKSDFLTGLEYFWNTFAAARSDVLLIVCGSASTWIINKLINNHGGLHNRITGSIHLNPFTLSECRDYYAARNISLNAYNMIESYMIFGGVPYYLKFLEPGLSLAQNVDALFFSPNAQLRNEYHNLYASLYKNPDNHLRIIEALAKKTSGLTRDELIKTTALTDGGSLTRVLKELELSHFIESYPAFGSTKKNTQFRLIDFYSKFYWSFIAHDVSKDEHYWSTNNQSGAHNAWAGFAFEQVCLAHLACIKQKLGISGIHTETSAWRSKQKIGGAHIDLVIKRSDGIINLCEMKFSRHSYTITSAYEKNLMNKLNLFAQETQAKEALHLTMATTYGLERNAHASIVQSEITMDDLFSSPF